MDFGRRENITDWVLGQFRSHYGDPSFNQTAGRSMTRESIDPSDVTVIPVLPASRARLPMRSAV